MGKSNTNMYGDFVLQVDDLVGQIVAELERKGIIDNTLLILPQTMAAPQKPISPNWPK